MMTTLQPGTLVGGKYRVERIIGRGGMGLVMEATHMGLGTRYALKFLAEEIASDPTALARFRREAQASATLKSEHICRVSDVGIEGKTPFIVMELLVGTDLARLSKVRTLDVATAALYVLQACNGLAEAHAAKIIHRDLKPGNLFLTRRPDGSALIKILDFGVAKAPDDSNQKLTGTANVVGSPGFMSPEQFRSSKSVDGRTDVWSLGVILYKLVSGRLPFKADGFAEFALAISRDPVPPLPEVPPGFESIIKRCLEKDVNKRIATVEQLAEALAPFSVSAQMSSPQIQLLPPPPISDEVSSGYGGQDAPAGGHTKMLGSDSMALPKQAAPKNEFRPAPVPAAKPQVPQVTAPAGPSALGRTQMSGHMALAATPPVGTPVVAKPAAPAAAKQTILGVAGVGADAVAARLSGSSPVMRPTVAETAMPGGTLSGTAVEGGERRYRPVADLMPGMTVGEYQIDQKIGEGGMGVVYAATHPMIGKRAAIKVIGAELGTDPVVVQRFVQEARSVNQIGHPNIVDVFAFGQLPDGRNYFVMEFLHGESLRARLFRAFMTIPEAIQILDEVASALEAAHEKAIVHRDLKPDNVYLASVRGGKIMVKLLDFGIAKLTSETGMAKTSTGEMIGTPAYLSPEQARGRNVDNRTDIYALGCMMYEMITGRLPFIAESPMDIVLMHISAAPRKPSELKPDIPQLLEQTIMQMLEKDPARRPPLVHVRTVFAELVASGVVQLEAGSGATFRSELVAGRTPRSSAQNQILGQSSSSNPVAGIPVTPSAGASLTGRRRNPSISEQQTAIHFNPGASTLTPSDQQATIVRSTAAAASPKGRGPLVALILFALAVGGGAAAYVFLNKQGQPAVAKQADAAVVATATADALAAPDAAVLAAAADAGAAVAPPAPILRSVIVRANVPAASIEVDEQVLDAKRGIAQVDLADGSHHVVVMAAGYATYDELVDIEAAHTAVEVKLVRGKSTRKQGTHVQRKTQTQGQTQTQTQTQTPTQTTTGTGSGTPVKKDANATIDPFAQ